MRRGIGRGNGVRKSLLSKYRTDVGVKEPLLSELRLGVQRGNVMAAVLLAVLGGHQVLIKYGRPAQHRSDDPNQKASYPQCFKVGSFLSGR